MGEHAEKQAAASSSLTHKITKPQASKVNSDPDTWSSSVWSKAREHAESAKSRKLAPLAAVVTAMVTMLTIGGDDVIWLLPFFVGKNKWTKTIAYLWYMEVVVIVSWIIKEIMKMIEVSHPDYPIRKVIQVISSICLTVFCVFLFYEWWTEEPDDDSEEESAESEGKGDAPSRRSDESEKSEITSSSLNEGSLQPPAKKQPELDDIKTHSDKSDDSSLPAAEAHLFHAPHNQHHEKLGLWMLFVVSMVGSMDNFAVYSYFLFSGMMTGWQLMLGVFIASSIIAAVAHGALAFKPVLKVVEKMPLWVIFACLSIWSYTEVARD